MTPATVAMAVEPRAKSGRKPHEAQASSVVRNEWLRRIEAEYRSATIAQHATLWLMQLGAPPSLLRAGLRIVSDELAHAASSHRVYVRAGGEGGPRLAQESLGLVRRSAALDEDAARVVVDVFCIGETVAVPLFRWLREECSVEVARKALDRILRDEVRHRDFGWTVLPWLLSEPYGERVRAMVERELPRCFARITTAYGSAGADAALEPRDRAWGLMPSARYGEALERTLVRDWVPRFGALGVDAARAWDERDRCSRD